MQLAVKIREARTRLAHRRAVRTAHNQLAAELAAFTVLVPLDREVPGQPVVILQKVPEEPAGKNRVHVDLHPPDPAEHVARLEALGARRIGERVTELSEQLGGGWWQRMADPQGTVFCVVADPPA